MNLEPFIIIHAEDSEDGIRYRDKFEFRFQVSGFKMEKTTKFEDLAVFGFAHFRHDSVVFKRVWHYTRCSVSSVRRQLCKQVYEITRLGEFRKDTRFVQQIRAAAGSVMDIIAEGYESDGNKEFINFLYIAKGSCGEVRSQIIRASDVGFIDNDTATHLYNDCLNLSKSISKFITSLKKSSITGQKNLKPET